MHIIHVSIHIKPDFIQEFIEATVENARNSMQEPDIARFDILQQEDDPTRFMLLEVYRSPEAPARHKETRHYALWRDTVIEMMAEPRAGIKYHNIFPEDAGW